MNDFVREIERQFEELAAEDKAAKDAGTLIGRHIQEQIADGHAYYRIVAVKGKTVTVEHINICDGWSIPMVEDMDCMIPLKYVKANIKRRDNMDAAFAKAGQ